MTADRLVALVHEYAKAGNPLGLSASGVETLSKELERLQKIEEEHDGLCRALVPVSSPNPPPPPPRISK